MGNYLIRCRVWRLGTGLPRLASCKARDEVVRSKLMMQAIASDEADNDFVDDLEDMADSLTGHIEAIVKSEFIEDEDEDEEEN